MMGHQMVRLDRHHIIFRVWAYCEIVLLAVTGMHDFDEYVQHELLLAVSVHGCCQCVLTSYHALSR